MQAGILGPDLEGRFERLERLVGSLTQFRRHDDRQVELLALGGHTLLELHQVHLRLLLVSQSGVSDGSILIE